MVSANKNTTHDSICLTYICSSAVNNGCRYELRVNFYDEDDNNLTISTATVTCKVELLAIV